MIPDPEWKFFEGTEQRIRHLTGHLRENEAALFTGRPLPWDPVDLAGRQAAIVQEMDYAARVEQALAQDPTPEQARHLDLHRRWILGALFETHPEIAPLLHHLRTAIATFKPQVQGRDTSRAGIRHILAESEDRDRREAAWNALSPLGEELVEPVRELFRLRETLARAVVEIGFPEIALHVAEQDRREAVALTDELERFTRQAHEETRREIAHLLGLHEVESWDLAYGLARMTPFDAEMFPVEGADAAAADQLRRWGFDPASLAGISETGDLPVDILRLTAENPETPRYLRRPAGGYDAWRLAFRVAGQGLRDLHVRARRHFLDEDSPVMIEAAGMILESVTLHPAWLGKITGAPGPAVRAHLRAQRLTRIHELRRRTAAGVFENLVYAQGDLDPQRLYAEIHEQLLQDSRGSRSLWPTHLGFVTRPLAEFGEVIAALVAAQTHEHLEELYPEAWTRPETGTWLRENYFAPGARIGWRDKVEGATGKPLGMDSLARELNVTFTAPMPEEAQEISDAEVEEYFKDIDLSDIDRD